MSSINCKAAVRSCPEQALMPIDHCYYPFPCVIVSEMLQLVFATCLVRSHTKRELSHIITHHYASLRIITQFITHHYSSLLKSITHHYAPLHYLRWVKNLLRCLKISCHKTMHSQPLRMKIEGGAGPPPRFLCVMMSKKEIYE